MVNIGKVIPCYVGAGLLKGRLRSHQLSPNQQASLPLGQIQYSPINHSHISFSFRRITAGGDINVHESSTIQIGHWVLQEFLRPKNNVPSALVLQLDQLAPAVRHTLNLMVAAASKDLGRYSPTIILLPFLEVDGQSAACFDLGMTGARWDEVEEFIAGTTPTFIEQFRLGGNRVMFINPYYQKGRFLGVRERSSVLQ